jgi:hypothetical protein
MPRGHILDLRWNAVLGEFRRNSLTQTELCQPDATRNTACGGHASSVKLGDQAPSFLKTLAEG